MTRRIVCSAALALATVLLATVLLPACADGGGPIDDTRRDSGVPPTPDAGKSCELGEEDCFGTCVLTDRDPLHCGACGNACADGERCQLGMCVVSCPAGQEPCTDGSGVTRCVSTDSDPANCGACGNVCGAGTVCSEGSCAASCGAGLTACEEGPSVACVDLDGAESHCGACGNACAAGETCVDGACRVICAEGETACGSLCVDTRDDDDNCGGCGVLCRDDERCMDGDCTLVCGGGTTDCDGVCRDLSADATNCGACGNACDPGEICMDGACALTCPSGQTVCAGACVFLDRDPANCGDCGDVCVAPVGGTVSCADSACVPACPSGQTNCAGTCRDTSADGSNCGACGNVCGDREVCMGGSCVSTVPPLPGPTFRVTEFGQTGCATLEHDAFTGDDRGGLAVSTSQLFVSGDEATARFGRNDLAGGTRLTQIWDGMVTNLRNNAVYVLADDAGPLERGGGTITRLLLLSASSGQLAGTQVRLSTPIPASGSTFGSTVGLFSGWDRVAVHNGSRVYVVDLASGDVTDLGAMTTPTRRTCENWAYWGLLEHSGSTYDLVYVESSTAVVRARVPSGATSPVASFTDLGDMCSIGASPTAGRWYFHVEYDSQFGGATISENVGSCPATFDTSSGLRVSSLGGASCTLVEHTDETGDDRGGIAVSSSHVFVSGDRATARFRRTDLGAGEPLGRIHDGMVSNLRTAEVYLLGNGGRPLPRGGGQVTQLVPVSATSGLPSGTPLDLSTPIDVAGTTSGGDVGLFAGYDRIAIHTGERVYHVALPSGDVTDLGPVPAPTGRRCENWAYWGVAEYFDGRLHLAYANGDQIDRMRVPEGSVTTVSTFTDLSDMCSLSFVPTLNRWYFHHEWDSQFTATSGENLVYCAGSWDQP